MRLDGLDPMIAKAMGQPPATRAGPVEDGQLQVCESNAPLALLAKERHPVQPHGDWLESGRLAIQHSAGTSAEEPGHEHDPGLADGRLLDGWTSAMRLFNRFLDTLKDIHVRTRLEPLPPAGAPGTLASLPGGFLRRSQKRLKPAIMQRAGVDFDHRSAGGVLPGSYKVAATHLALMPEQSGWLYATTERCASSVLSDLHQRLSAMSWKAAGVFLGLVTSLTVEKLSGRQHSHRQRCTARRSLLKCASVDPENPFVRSRKIVSTLDSQPGVLPRYNYAQPKEGCWRIVPAWLRTTLPHLLAQHNQN